MYKPRVETIYRRLLANPEASQRSRLNALERLSTVPLSLVLKLLKDPATPQRLRARLVERYDAEMFIRKGAANA